MSKRNLWVAGGAVASLLVLVAGWFLAVSPVRHKTSDTKAATATLNAQNDVLQTQLNQLIAQDKGVTAKQAQLANIGSEIPSDPHLPQLIRTLSSAASKSAVDMVSLTPSAPTASNVGATTLSPTAPTSSAGAAGAGAAASAGATYQTIPVALQVQGDYAGLEEFVRELETMKRIFVVTQVGLSPNAGAGAQSNTVQRTPGGQTQTIHTLTATFTGSIFMTDASTTSISLPALSGAAAPAGH